MSNTVRGALFFILGAASASFITYKVVEKKFKDIADEEIESVKAMYERKLAKLELDKPVKELKRVTITDDGVYEEKEETPTKVNINPYSSLVNNLGYSDDKKEEKEEVAVNTDIEIVPPEDFGEYGYKCESLTYYADKVLTLDDDTKITDIEKYVGYDSLNTFGEYEDDSVFVRNHGMKTDFEILKDSRTYSDVVGDDE